MHVLAPAPGLGAGSDLGSAAGRHTQCPPRGWPQAFDSLGSFSPALDYPAAAAAALLGSAGRPFPPVLEARAITRHGGTASTPDPPLLQGADWDLGDTAWKQLAEPVKVNVQPLESLLGFTGTADRWTSPMVARTRKASGQVENRRAKDVSLHEARPLP